jgi:hypothetical protein
MTISTNDNTYITLPISLLLFEPKGMNPNSPKVPIGRNEEEQKDRVSLLLEPGGTKWND